MSKTREQLLEEQIGFGDLKLQALLELTNAINGIASYEQLIQLFEFILKQQLGLTKFMFILKREDWDVALKSGVKLKIKDFEIQRDLAKFEEVTLLDSSPIELLNEFNYIIPVVHKEQKLAFLLVADDTDILNNQSQPRLTKFLQTITNVLVVALENKRLNKAMLRQVELKKELEIAKEMQQFLFPSVLPKNERMDISAKYRTHREVGGDYYDFFEVGENEYIFCIADVSGKGVSAALLMANFQASVRALATYNSFSLEELVVELNKIVFGNAQGEKFITFFIAYLDLNSRRLKYINAGHNSPVLTDGKKHKALDEGTVGLGMFEELPFLDLREMQLPRNATILLYTDGVVELRNNKGVQFELERLINIIHAYYPLKTDDLNALIFSKLDEWRDDEDFVDDTAVLTCRFF
jgi:sigma-B regulation protein RsbU (phosphoserine phosphatase)